MATSLYCIGSSYTHQWPMYQSSCSIIIIIVYFIISSKCRHKTNVQCVEELMVSAADAGRSIPGVSVQCMLHSSSYKMSEIFSLHAAGLQSRLLSVAHIDI